MRSSLEARRIVTGAEEEQGDGQVVAVPLLAPRNDLGAFRAARMDGPPFSDAEIDLLDKLAAPVAMLLQSVLRIGTERWQSAQLALAHDLGIRAAALIDADVFLGPLANLISELYQNALPGIPRSYGQLAVQLFTVDPVRSQVVLQGSSRPVSCESAQGLALTLREATAAKGQDDLVAWTAVHRKVERVEDVRLDPRCPESILRPPIVRAELAAPLLFRNQLVGVLDLQSNQPGGFTADDALLVDSLANAVAAVIWSAALYHSERSRRQVGDRIRKAVGPLSPDMMLDQVLDAILLELEGIVPFYVAGLYLQDGHELYAAAIRGRDGSSIGEFPLNEVPWLTAAMRTDHAVVRPAQSPADALGSMYGLPADYSAIAAPLRTADSSVGLLLVLHEKSAWYGSKAQ